MRAYVFMPVAFACAILAASCTKSNDTNANATAAPTDTPSPAASGDTVVSMGTPSPEPTATTATDMPAGSASPSAAVTTPAATVAFTDVTGSFAAPAITALGQLGSLDATTGAFRPNAPIMRREFVRWLYKTNNAVFADTPSDEFHPGTSDEKPAFSDLKPSDPDFPYIQGMSDSGVSVGFPDKTFEADVPITREQAVSIKALVDGGGIYAGYLGKSNLAFASTKLPAWKDRSAVSVTYRPAMAADADMEGQGKVDNIGRTFGAIAVFSPQKALTRGEAATMLMVIGGHSTNMDYKRTVTSALHPAVSPSP